MEESPYDLPLNRENRRTSVTPAIRNRKHHQSNVWMFDSPKIDRRFVILGDVAFVHIVLLEGDPAVLDYDPAPPAVLAIAADEPYQTSLDAIVRYVDGRQEWLEFKRARDTGPQRKKRSRAQLDAQANAAAAAGVTYRVLTERDLTGKELLFDNWLHLCAAITRARGVPSYREREILDCQLDTCRTCTVGSLLSEHSADPAVMLSVIAQRLQAGKLDCDLVSQYFGRNSVLLQAHP
jgi:hypothetical protein